MTGRCCEDSRYHAVTPAAQPVTALTGKLRPVDREATQKGLCRSQLDSSGVGHSPHWDNQDPRSWQLSPQSHSQTSMVQQRQTHHSRQIPDVARNCLGSQIQAKLEGLEAGGQGLQARLRQRIRA